MEKKYFIFHKPYGVLSQFTRESAHHMVLSDYYAFPADVYPVGRLDKDSEGLLLLTNDKKLTDAVLNPKMEKSKTYLVQVDGNISDKAISTLQGGVSIKVPGKGMAKTRPCTVKKYDGSGMEEREPPVRFRKDIPTSWIKIILTEGKNRQIRRMCAGVGFPALRIIRIAIGKLSLGDLKKGKVKEISAKSLSTSLFLGP